MDGAVVFFARASVVESLTFRAAFSVEEDTADVFVSVVDELKNLKPLLSTSSFFLLSLQPMKLDIKMAVAINGIVYFTFVM